MDILQAARKLRPGTAWVLNGTVLSQAEDSAPRVTVPTPAELQVAMDSDSYAEKRLMEYPSVGDQLDALWKGGQAQADMSAKVQAVKAKFPKPS